MFKRGEWVQIRYSNPVRGRMPWSEILFEIDEQIGPNIFRLVVRSMSINLSNLSGILEKLILFFKS